MALTWTDDCHRIDWNELARLARVAPLGEKSPDTLRTVFGNSRFKFFVFDEADRLVAAGRALADGAD
ncbi:MAG TPA: hypothetical protein VGD18_02455 [Thiobacillaceae bacterium]